jgi:hypothetical protein
MCDAYLYTSYASVTMSLPAQTLHDYAPEEVDMLCIP